MGAGDQGGGNPRRSISSAQGTPGKARTTMLSRRKLLQGSGVSALASALPGGRASAQAWPNRFVRLIVPLAPGGPTDVAARLIAEPLSKMWGHQVVIENKPGGGTNVAG